MNRWKYGVIAGVVAALSLASVGCREEGPAEKAGEAIDEAVEDAQEGLDDLVDEGGPLEEAGEEADEAIERAKEDAREVFE